MAGVTIRIFLADGTPLGLRIIEKTGWSGRGYEFARHDWPMTSNRDDFGRPGIYLLSGVGDDGRERIYLGEADDLRTRLKQHFASPSKDFVTRAAAFMGKDETLNKAHVRYMESRLLTLAHAAKRATVENGNQSSIPSLSEYDRADADAFLEGVLQVLPLVGVDAFVPPAKVTGTDGTLFLNLRGIKARGRDAPEGFVVYAGSTAAREPAPSLHEYVGRVAQELGFRRPVPRGRTGLSAHAGPHIRVAIDGNARTSLEWTSGLEGRRTAELEADPRRCDRIATPRPG